jgi:hypothetical protein
MTSSREPRQSVGASAGADQALVASDQAASRLAPLGFDPSREELLELTEGVNEWLARASHLGPAQKRVIMALGADWGPSPDHQATKRMWHGITGRGIKRQRGPLYVVEHKHCTNNCWRLNDNGLRLQVALRHTQPSSARPNND